MPDLRPDEIDNTKYQFTSDHDYDGNTIINLGGEKPQSPVSLVYDDSGTHRKETYSSLQSAVDAAESAGGGIVNIGPTYDDSNESSLPVTVESTGIVIASARGKDELVVDSGGNGFLQVSLGNSRPPGFKMVGLTIRDTSPGSSGSPTIDVQDSSYVSFVDIDIDHNNLGGATAYHTENTGTSAPNSITFTRCTAEQIGGIMWHVESDSHSTVLQNCRLHEGGAEGVYFDGLSHQVSIDGCQIQDCDKAGVRVQNAQNVHIENTYFEANGVDTTGGDQTEIKAQNSAGNVYVNNCWFNGDGSTPRLMNQDCSGHVEYRHLRYDDGYNNIFDMNNGTATVDRQSVVASGNGDPNLFLIDADMGKIYDGNTVVGAGSNNGGNSDVSGVDLSSVTGDRDNEMAISDGTDFTAGTVATWDSGASDWIVDAESALMAGKAVADDGIPYDTLQGAIDAATDMVKAGRGTFSEAVQISTADLTLEGMGMHSTLIDGGTTGHAVQISASDVTVKNLGVQTTAGGGNSFAGVRVDEGQTDARVENVRVVDSDIDGVSIFDDGTASGTHKNHLVTGCLIEAADGDGVKVDFSHEATVVQNTRVLSGVSGDGIGMSCDQNAVKDCVVDGVGGTGIFQSGDDGSVTGCNVFDAGNDGISIHDDNHLIVGNRVGGSTNSDIDTGSGNGTITANETGGLS